MRQKLGNFATTLKKGVDKSLGKFLIPVGIERDGFALVTNATGAANAVDILGDATVILSRKVEVDDVFDVGDVPATASDAGGDKDRASTGAESTTRSMLAGV